MNYQQTLDYLFSRLPIYQREGKAAYKSNLDNIIAATGYLEKPQTKFNSIHVAGTNGKGSTSHMLASIFQEAKYKVGLYTSPHLKDFRERIKINGEMIPQAEVVKFVKNNKLYFEKINLSFFEFTVALAFQYFAYKKVDIAIIETGLGGRLDSTNIITPELSIITNISLDHTNLLGNDIKKIAEEKGGIIKQNIPVIIGRYQDEITHIFQSIANKKNSLLRYAKKHNFKSDLKGGFQKENTNTVVSSIIELQKKKWKINNTHIKTGLLNTIKNTKLLGRWQTLGSKPLIICDTGHNEEAIRLIFNEIEKTKHKNLHVVFGVVNDKNLDSILNLLPKDAQYYFCRPNIARGLDEDTLQYFASKKEIYGNSYTDVTTALIAAKNQATNEDFIFIGGSTFIVAEVL